MNSFLFVIAFAFALIHFTNGMLDFSNGTLVTPCGNRTNSREKFGTLKYNKNMSRLELRCAEGFTFANRPTNICNKTTKNFTVGSNLFKCKEGNANRCPKIPKGQVGACVMSCKQDSECSGKTKKCCFNGCGYACVTSVALGKCSSQEKRFKSIMEKSTTCNSNDKKYWCAGFYEKITENCLNVMFKRIPDFIKSMTKEDLELMLKSPTARKHFIKQLDRMSNRTLARVMATSKETVGLIFKGLNPQTLLHIRNSFIQKTIGRLFVREHGRLAGQWPVNAFENKGIIIAWLPNNIRKLLVKHSKINDILKSIDAMTAGAIFKHWPGFVRFVVRNKGDCSKWTTETFQALNRFILAIPDGCFKKIPVKQLCDTVPSLKMVKALGQHPMIAGRILQRLSKEQCNGKKLASYTSEEFKLGSILCGAKVKMLKSLTKEQVSFDMANVVCSCPRVSTANKLIMLLKLKDKVAVSKWTADNLKLAYRCLNKKTCNEIDKNVMSKFIKLDITKEVCEREIGLVPSDVLSCTKSKVEDVLGKASTWTSMKPCQELLRDYTASFTDMKSKKYVKEILKRLRGLQSKGRGLKRLFIHFMSTGEANFNDFLSELNCATIKKNTADVIRDLNLNDDSPDGDKALQDRSTKNIPKRVASCVLNVFKETTGSLTKEEDLKPLGAQLLKGITQFLISKLEDKDAVLKVFESIDELTDVRVKALVKRLIEVKGDVDPELVCQLGSAVMHLPLDKLKTLPVDPSEGCSWVEEAGKTNLQQISKKDLEKVAKEALDKLGDKIDQDKLTKLNALVAGLSKEDLKKIADDSVLDAIKIFISSKAGKEYADKLKDLIDRLRTQRTGKFTEDDLCEIGPALNTLIKDDFEKCDKATVQNARDCLTTVNFKEDVLKVIKDKLADSPKRKRRAADLSSYKAEDVLNEGSLLTPDEIRTIQHSVYVEIAADIGKRDFTPEQKATLEAWAHVAKNGDASQMSTDLIKNLGAVCRGLSAEDIGKLNFADDDTIQGCSQQKGFSKEQLDKGLEQIKSKKGKKISDMAQEEIVALGYFAIGMTTDEIGSIPKDSYSGLYDSFNEMTGWNEEQLVKLKERLVEIKGPVSGWKENDFTEANVAVGGLSESEIKSLSKESIQAIPADGIGAIPPNKMKYFSEEQLGFLSPSQSRSLTDEQKKQVPGLCEKDNIDCSTPTPPPSGANQVTMGTMLLVTMATLTMLF